MNWIPIVGLFAWVVGASAIVGGVAHALLQRKQRTTAAAVTALYLGVLGLLIFWVVS